MSALPPFLGTLVGATVGYFAAKRHPNRGAIIGGGIGLAGGLLANAFATSFGNAIGQGITNGTVTAASNAAEVAATLVPLVAAKKQTIMGMNGVSAVATVGAGGCGCKSKQSPKVTEVGTSSASEDKPCCDECAKKVQA